ncbi:MAG: hypothetical protein NVS3B20_10470 [Polyangiales bacterium]
MIAADGASFSSALPALLVYVLAPAMALVGVLSLGLYKMERWLKRRRAPDKAGKSHPV